MTTTGKIVQTFSNDEYPNEISFDGQTTYVEMLPRGKKISRNALFSLGARVGERKGGRRRGGGKTESKRK